MDQFDDSTLNLICLKRGIEIDTTREEKLKDLKVWLTISNLRDVQHMLLVVTRVFDYSFDAFEENAEMNEYQILRTCPNEIYFYTLQRVFEKAYGLDDLRSILEFKRKQKSVSK